MVAGCHFEKKENRRNSAVISDIFTKFGVLVATSRDVIFRLQ